MILGFDGLYEDDGVTVVPIASRKYFVTVSKKQSAKVVHGGGNCPLIYDAEGKRRVAVVSVDPATLRVFVRCKYCFG